MIGRGVLLVLAAGRRLGLPLDGVVEVGEVLLVEEVPGSRPSIRGITLARGRLVPLAHLGALVSGGQCPAAEAERTQVLATVDHRWLALEVDEVEPAPNAEILPPPDGSDFGAWAVGVVRREDDWVPVLNLDALADRLQG